jgi:hypothetical protein
MQTGVAEAVEEGDYRQQPDTATGADEMRQTR